MSLCGPYAVFFSDEYKGRIVQNLHSAFSIQHQFIVTTGCQAPRRSKGITEIIWLHKTLNRVVWTAFKNLDHWYLVALHRRTSVTWAGVNLEIMVFHNLLFFGQPLLSSHFLQHYSRDLVYQAQRSLSRRGPAGHPSEACECSRLTPLKDSDEQCCLLWVCLNNSSSPASHTQHQHHLTTQTNQTTRKMRNEVLKFSGPWLTLFCTKLCQNKNGLLPFSPIEIHTYLTYKRTDMMLHTMWLKKSF